MPHLPAEEDYHTPASHPDVPVFWNRINAYRRMGFQTYWSKQDVQLDDMNREFLYGPCPACMAICSQTAASRYARRIPFHRPVRHPPAGCRMYSSSMITCLPEISSRDRDNADIDRPGCFYRSRHSASAL